MYFSKPGSRLLARHRADQVRRATATIALFLVGLVAALPVRAADDPTPVPTHGLGEVMRYGAGEPTLLLVPCMSCRWNQWQPFMERNAERYTMYAITVPGYGGTPVPDLPRNTGGTPWRDHLLDSLSALIDAEGIEDAVVVGHSWGTMVAVQLAARRADVVSRVVAIDGSIESVTWTAATPEERLRRAAEVIERRTAQFADAEQWRTFNGVGLGSEPTVSTERARRALLYHGSFMATDRGALLQYWRENVLIDLTADLRRLEVPVLNLDAVNGDAAAMEEARRQALADLAAAGAPDNVHTVFLYETRHFVMDQRPELLDRLIADFLAGEPVSDFRPEPTTGS